MHLDKFEPNAQNAQYFRHMTGPLNLISTNRSCFFQNICVIEIRLSDFHVCYKNELKKATSQKKGKKAIDISRNLAAATSWENFNCQFESRQQKYSIRPFQVFSSLLEWTKWECSPHIRGNGKYFMTRRCLSKYYKSLYQGIGFWKIAMLRKHLVSPLRIEAGNILHTFAKRELQITRSFDEQWNFLSGELTR